MDTVALTSLVFEKIAFFLHFGNRETDSQTDRQTNRWTFPSHEAVFAVASGGLKSDFLKKKLSNLELWSLITTNRKSYIGYSKNPFLNL